jgi:hypothetical protein
MKGRPGIERGARNWPYFASVWWIESSGDEFVAGDQLDSNFTLNEAEEGSFKGKTLIWPIGNRLRSRSKWNAEKRYLMTRPTETGCNSFPIVLMMPRSQAASNQGTRNRRRGGGGRNIESLSGWLIFCFVHGSTGLAIAQRLPGFRATERRHVAVHHRLPPEHGQQRLGLFGRTGLFGQQQPRHRYPPLVHNNASQRSSHSVPVDCLHRRRQTSVDPLALQLHQGSDCHGDKTAEKFCIWRPHALRPRHQPRLDPETSNGRLHGRWYHHRQRLGKIGLRPATLLSKVPHPLPPTLTPSDSKTRFKSTAVDLNFIVSSVPESIRVLVPFC